jgi:hypothetical protein
VRQTQSTISEFTFTFVFSSDIDSYYASIDHAVLLGLLGRFVKDPVVLDLIC